ncbi:surfeit locus protein 1-like [Mytilus trossulus]|uniref:surfeit locus protein 1-like n=1 Tax=Mytilus trossulus TaxID=6551 RepID=UPI0030060129
MNSSGIRKMKRIMSQCLRLMRLQSTKKPLQRPRIDPYIKSGLFNEGGIILLTVPVAAFCLGVWQIQRRIEKLELIKSLEEKTGNNPVPLPSKLDDIYDLEYQCVKVRGVFDHSKSIELGPRTNIKDAMYSSGHGGSLLSSGRQTGFWLITPLKLSDRNATILVNRGWIPKNKDERKLYKRPETQPEGEVEIVGVVRTDEKKNSFTPKNNPGHNLWYYRDIEQIAKNLGTVPVYLDANLASTVRGGPIGGQTVVKLHNDHVSYIFTWFSLCAITGFLWYRKFVRPAPSKLLHEIYRREKGL